MIKLMQCTAVMKKLHFQDYRYLCEFLSEAKTLLYYIALKKQTKRNNRGFCQLRNSVYWISDNSFLPWPVCLVFFFHNLGSNFPRGVQNVCKWEFKIHQIDNIKGKVKT